LTIPLYLRHTLEILGQDDIETELDLRHDHWATLTDGDLECEKSLQSLPSNDVNVGGKQKPPTASKPSPSTPGILNAQDEYEFCKWLWVQPLIQLLKIGSHTTRFIMVNENPHACRFHPLVRKGCQQFESTRPKSRRDSGERGLSVPSSPKKTLHSSESMSCFDVYGGFNIASGMNCV